METETAEIEKEPRTTLAYLRNEKTAESSDQWPSIQQYGQVFRMTPSCSGSSLLLVIHAFGYWNHQQRQCTTKRNVLMVNTGQPVFY